VDTGGYVKGSDDVFEGEIRSQVEIAIEEAQAILFVVDAANGILDLDETVAKLLRRSKKDVFLVVNKVDNSDRLLAATEFYSLGFDNFYTISAVSGSGTGELLDDLLKNRVRKTE
jgi:GTP-binding protein